MFAPGVPLLPAAQPEIAGHNLITLARMEIGGTRFLLPLADIVAVIEPTAMEAHESDPDGIWIGHVRSHQGMIAVASGSAVIRAANTSIAPGRIAILRGEYPVGLAVDRMLSAQAVSRESLLPLPSAVPCIQSSLVSNVFWGEDDKLELLLDREALVAGLDANLLNPEGQPRSSSHARQELLARYGEIDYRHGLEVRFDASPERWLVPMSTVRLVTDSRKPHPLPRAHRKVVGLVSWQRQPIPVIDPSNEIKLARPVSFPAKFVVIGEPVGIGESSINADAALVVDRIIGIHHDLRIEQDYAWDDTGDALNILRIPELLT